MLDELKKVVFLNGLRGNIFVPLRNNDSHNYTLGLYYYILEAKPSSGKQILLIGSSKQDGRNSFVGNNIPIQDVRLIFTEEGIKNILGTIEETQRQLQKVSDEYAEIAQFIQNSQGKQFDPKTQKFEQMLQLLKEDNTPPEQIIAKLVQAYERYE